VNKTLENLLLWVGAAGAVISAISYIIVIIVLVVGIESKMEMQQLLLVSIIGAVAGLLITFMLRAQGVILASNEPENKIVMTEYRKALNKKKKLKKLHTINHYVIKKFVFDIFTKALTIAASTYFMVSIFSQGNGDTSLVGLAFANTFMFISFGILALRGSYIYYNEDHIEAVKQITIVLNTEKEGDNNVNLR